MRGIGIVHTRYGALRGAEKDGITHFFGVPYAAPPVGELRWRAPMPPAAWEGVRECVAFGNVACQVPGMVGQQPLDASTQSEDCLYLNIWTPAQSASERLPVLVWVHGGAFLGGMSSEPVYDGQHMAGKGVISVTINYRLGALGFLAHPALSAESEHGVSGNYGILDIMQAIAWVRENIASFGGDPDRVTVEGQSAGGMAVCTLLASPLTRGMLAGAIIQSGGPRPEVPRTLAEGEAAGLEFQKNAGAADLAQLRAMDPQFLLRVPVSPSGGMLPFRPIIDGYILRESPYDAFVSGRIHDVPVMFGCNDGEGSFLPRGTEPTEENLRAALSPAEYETFLALYGQDTPAALTAAGRDRGYATLRHVAAAMSAVRSAPVYMYYFRQPLCVEGRIVPSHHSAENFFIFHTLHVYGKCTTNGKTFRAEFDQGAYDLSDEMTAYWAEFARKGDPNRVGLAHWPAYTPAEDAVMHLRQGDRAAHPSDYPAQMAFLTELIRKA